MKTNATLVDVRGDVCEFSDLIGLSGTLYLSEDNSTNYFNPGGAEWLEFRRKRVTRKGGQVRVFTHLGNTFVFDTN